jgi:hypothetical protein
MRVGGVARRLGLRARLAGGARDQTGWKPVQLVPERARPDRGGLPIRVRPNENQAIWIEIYTGRNRPAGIYRGAVDVTADGRTAHVPIELELFDFALPDENSMHAMIYYESSQVEPIRDAISTRPIIAAHRTASSWCTPTTSRACRLPRAASRVTTSHGPAATKGPARDGQRHRPLSFYGPGDAFDDRARAWRRADEVDDVPPRAMASRADVPIQPDDRARRNIRILTLADNVHSNRDRAAVTVFVTSRYVEALDRAIDIWCAGPQDFDVDARREAPAAAVLVLQRRRPAGGRSSSMRRRRTRVP